MIINPNSPEFKKILKEEADRLKYRMMLENEKKSILKQLNEMNGDSTESHKETKIKALQEEKNSILKALKEHECMDVEKSDEIKESSLNESEQLIGGSKERLDWELKNLILPVWRDKKGYKINKQSYAQEIQKATQDNFKGKWGVADGWIVYNSKEVLDKKNMSGLGMGQSFA